MNNNIRNLAIGAFAVLCAAPIAAQNTYSGYFLDNYTYRHQLNPALAPEDNFVGFPGLGNINVGMHGNAHVSDFIYDVNGKTSLFTNPNLNTADVMSKFSDHNKLGVGLKLGVLDFGFKAFGGYNTISINAVANADVSVPKSILALAREGLSNRTYDITDLRGDAVAYGEIALNHSREIKQLPGLRVGLTAKFLVGVGALQARFNKAHLNLGANGWEALTNADIYTSVKGVRYETDVNDNTGANYVSGIETDDLSAPNGYGVAFDLGAEYKWRDFTFSAAVLDLGFINFSETVLASTNGDRMVNTDAYTFQIGGEDSDAEWDRIRDDFSKLYELEDNGNIGSHNYTLKATMNIGVEYEFPLYRKLHFGLLNTTRFAGNLTSTNFRVSANVQPVKCFSASVNGVFGTYGAGFGWLLNFSTKGFNLFLGMDHTLGKLAKQGVPLNSNAQVNLGINFPF